MKNLKITIEYWKEGNLFMAFCPELDMIGQGYSLEEAKKNLFLTIEIQLEEMKKLGTLQDFFNDLGIDTSTSDTVVFSEKEFIGIDKDFVHLEFI
jgi:predicted RNase H-like HicB family nuclease